MKRRKKKTVDLVERFQTTCGWCGRRIPPDVEVFGAGGKGRSEFDLTPHAGHNYQEKQVKRALEEVEK